MRDIGFALVSPHRLLQAAVAAVIVAAAYTYGEPEVRFEVDRLLFMPAASVAFRLGLPFDMGAGPHFGWRHQTEAQASVGVPDVHPVR